MAGTITASAPVKAATVEAVVYPRCVCGQPMIRHRADVCEGYRPSRPIVPLGVVAYTHRSRLCRALWWLEHMIRRGRSALERRF